jgi:hypothetical protein
MRRVTLLCSTLALLLGSPALAKPGAKNPLLSEYAKTRPRATSGRFVAVPLGQRAIRSPVTSAALANPASTGQSDARIVFTPATGKRAGSLTVTIPEYYTGSSVGGTSSLRQLFGTDVRGRSAVFTGTLAIARHSRYTSFGPATYTGTVRPGTTLSQDGLKQALRGLYVNPLTVKLTPAK